MFGCLTSGIARSGNADPAYDYTTFPEIAATGRDAYAQAGVTNPRDQIATRALPEYLDYRGRLLAQLFAEEGLAARDAA